jgi:hypothetical protein
MNTHMNTHKNTHKNTVERGLVTCFQSWKYNRMESTRPLRVERPYSELISNSFNINNTTCCVGCSIEQHIHGMQEASLPLTNYASRTSNTKQWTTLENRIFCFFLNLRQPHITSEIRILCFYMYLRLQHISSDILIFCFYLNLRLTYFFTHASGTWYLRNSTAPQTNR